MNHFEYKVLDIPAKGFFGGKINYQQLADKLNELGAQGWELITSTDTNMWEGASRGIILILKRPLNN